MRNDLQQEVRLRQSPDLRWAARKRSMLVAHCRYSDRDRTVLQDALQRVLLDPNSGHASFFGNPQSSRPPAIGG